MVLATFSALAADRYQIELIVFAQNPPNTEWLDQTQSLIEWPPGVVDVSAFAPVSRQNRLLNTAYGVLSGNASYRPLLHVAWIQAIDPDNIGEAVRVRDSEGLVNGFVRVQRGQYLNLIVDLEYQPDAGRYYRLHEKRRIKFNETHYLDHPKLGVVARVSPR